MIAPRTELSFYTKLKLGMYERGESMPIESIKYRTLPREGVNLCIQRAQCARKACAEAHLHARFLSVTRHLYDRNEIVRA